MECVDKNIQRRLNLDRTECLPGWEPHELEAIREMENNILGDEYDDFNF